MQVVIGFTIETHRGEECTDTHAYSFDVSTEEISIKNHRYNYSFEYYKTMEIFFFFTANHQAAIT